MSSELIAKKSFIEQRKTQRQPDLQIILASNRQPVGPLHIPAAQRKTIVTVEPSNCRWPIGDPQESGFYLCGGPSIPGESYCAHHKALAHVPATAPKRAA